jgi:copper transporter 1
LVADAVAFGIACILMLIAMAYNGYVIIMIIIGAGFGKFVGDWMSQKVVVGVKTSPLGKAAESTDDATVYAAVRSRSSLFGKQGV